MSMHQQIIDAIVLADAIGDQTQDIKALIHNLQRIKATK